MEYFKLKEAIDELEFIKDRFYGFPEETGISNDIGNVQNAIKAINELREYKNLEKQGKLLKLPCAVGDTVYVLRIDNLAYMMNDKKVWEIIEEKFEMRHFDCIGKTVFLTREEAEAALKEL